MKDFFSDITERFKDIPPWGYALIAGGVLLLAWLSTRSGGGSSEESERVVYSVDAGAETNSNEALWRMQDEVNKMEEEYQTKLDHLEESQETSFGNFKSTLQDSLDGKLDQIQNSVSEQESDMNKELNSLQKVIDNMKNAPKTSTKKSSSSNSSSSSNQKSKPIDTVPNKKYATPKRGFNTGTSIVDYMKNIGKNASFSNRKKLAESVGISNYRGTASQNVTLLKKLRG